MLLFLGVLRNGDECKKPACQLEETELSNDKCFFPSSVASYCLVLSTQELLEFCGGHLLLSDAFD